LSRILVGSVGDEPEVPRPLDVRICLIGSIHVTKLLIFLIHVFTGWRWENVSADEFVNCTLNDARITCWCWFGGSPEPPAPLRYQRLQKSWNQSPRRGSSGPASNEWMR